MVDLTTWTDQDVRDSFEWYDRNIAIVADLGRGYGDVPQAMFDAYDALETELLNRGLYKLN